MTDFAETDLGLLYLADGFSPVMRWDGITPSMELAGLAAPATAPAITSPGSGSTLGVYYAYVRYKDRFGFKSNLSPISAAAIVKGNLTGTITGATNADPIVISAAGHNRATGDEVTITGVGGNTAANGTWTITVIDANSFSLDGSQGSGAYTSGGSWTASPIITYTGLAVPTDPKVTRRQILRNTDGQADVFYVDIDTDDLTSTTLTSTRTDTELATQEAQAILDDLALPLANRRDVPPNHKPYLFHLLSRLFYLGSVDYKRGHVKVTVASTTVTGVGTDWTEAMEGRYLYVTGANESYLISAVDETAQTLTLSTAYLGPTDLFARYAIRPAPAERRTMYWSEAGEPEAVSVFNALSIPENSDEITGGFVRGSFGYILEKRHIHKLTFQDDPARDGGLFPAADRGCINNRCWVLVDSTAYMLDEEGVHRFGGGESGSVSDAIQDLFRPGANVPYAINWQAQEQFHAGHWRQHSTIRWFVCFEGDYLPRHALCYNYRADRWWIERYPFAIASAAKGEVRGVPCVFLGGDGRQVFVSWEGHLDVAQSSAGTVRGTATSAGVLSLSDSGASFPASFVGAPVVIVAGKGKGQERRIVDVSATTLYLDRPWLDRPDTTSIYQVGGIQWQLRLSDFRFAVAEEHKDRRVELVFEPQSRAALLDMRYYYDFSDTPVTQRETVQGAKQRGFSSTAGQTDLVLDLTRVRGVASHLLPDHREDSSEGTRFVQLELGGCSNGEEQKLRQVTMNGVTMPGQLEAP